MRGAIERWRHGRAKTPFAELRLASGSLHVAIQIVLWGALVAAVLIAVAVVRQAAAFQNELELRNAERITAESSNLCQRRGLGTGTHEHLLCMMDLNAVRAVQEASDLQSMGLP